MKALLGKVNGIEGKFFTEDADGSVVELKNGDGITLGMTVFGDSSNSVSAMITIAMQGSSEIVSLSGSSRQLFDYSLVNEDEVDGALSEESVEAANGILAALEDTEDTDKQDETVDEETAAGEENATGDAGTAYGQDGVFQARDGSATDFSAGLRNTEFNVQAGPEADEIVIPPLTTSETPLEYAFETNNETRTTTYEVTDTRIVQETFTNYRTEIVPGTESYSNETRFNLNGSEQASFDGTTTGILDIGHMTNDISINISNYKFTDTVNHNGKVTGNKDDGEIILYNSSDNSEIRIDIDDFLTDINNEPSTLNIQGYGDFDSFEVRHTQDAFGEGGRSQQFFVDGVVENTVYPDTEIQVPFEDTRDVVEMFTETRVETETIEGQTELTMLFNKVELDFDAIDEMVLDNSVDTIHMENNQLTLNLDDVLAVADNKQITFEGIAGAEITVDQAITKVDSFESNGDTFDVYEYSSAGDTLSINIDTDINIDGI